MKGRRIAFIAAGKAALEDFLVPEPKRGEVLLKQEYSVISAGTERANLLNLPNTRGSDAPDFGTVGAPGPSEKFPFYPGYSGIGRVIAVGDGVTGLPLGTRILATWSSGHRSHSVLEAATMTKVADNRIDSLDAAFVPIAAMGLHGVRKLELELGQSVVVIGLGLLGIFAVQAAARSGAVPVIVTDFDPKRRALALALGADHAFSPDEAYLPERIRDLTQGRGAHGVVEVTGSAKALQQALTYVAQEGCVSLLGCTRVSDAPIDFYQYVHRRGVSLVGAHTCVRPLRDSRPGCWTEQGDYCALLSLIAAKRFQVQPLMTELIPPENAPEIYQRLAQDKSMPLGIVFDWSKATS